MYFQHIVLNGFKNEFGESMVMKKKVKGKTQSKKGKTKSKKTAKRKKR